MSTLLFIKHDDLLNIEVLLRNILDFFDIRGIQFFRSFQRFEVMDFVDRPVPKTLIITWKACAFVCETSACCPSRETITRYVVPEIMTPPLNLATKYDEERIVFLDSSFPTEAWVKKLIWPRKAIQVIPFICLWEVLSSNSFKLCLKLYKTISNTLLGYRNRSEKTKVLLHTMRFYSPCFSPCFPTLPQMFHLVCLFTPKHDVYKFQLQTFLSRKCKERILQTKTELLGQSLN